MLRTLFSLLTVVALTTPLVGIVGCDADEEVMEVETQQGETEIERDSETGALQVDD